MGHKTTVDSIIHAQAILTVDESNCLLHNHSVIIDGGKILNILPHADAKQNYCSENSYDLQQHVLMPGLINAHGHAAMSLMRGLADDYPLMDWLNDHIWPAENAFVSDTFVHDGTELAMAEMIRSGTTCYSDMYFFPEAAAQITAKVGMRAQFTSPVFDFPSNWGDGPDDYLNKAQDLAKLYHDNELINIALGPHAPYTVSDGPMQDAQALADKNNLAMQIHLHETAFEVESAEAESGQRPIARLAALGLFNANLQCVHMTTLNAQDIKTVAEHGASIIHCPESNLKLASGMTPIQQCIDAGINIALGTDGAASNNGLNLFSEMRTAALLAKAVAGDATAVDADTAIRMATINGAKALGIDAITGSLEVGKAADIIAIDFSQLEMQPVHNINSQIAYTHPADKVNYSWVAGKCLMQNRKLLGIDELDVIKRAQQWHKKLQQKAEEQAQEQNS